MDQEKIGLFIKQLRNEKNLTQQELADKLSVSFKTISKWECGKGLPEVSLMIPLCKELNITVNELLSGERLNMENYNENSEKNILNALRGKEQADKHLLQIEIVVGVLSTFILLACTITAAYVEMETWLKVLLIVGGFVICLIGLAFAIGIEQKAGYYECQKCNHRYVPRYVSVLMAMHYGRTRYMKCPKCGKYSYQKKRISK